MKNLLAVPVLAVALTGCNNQPAKLPPEVPSAVPSAPTVVAKKPIMVVKNKDGSVTASTGPNDPLQLTVKVDGTVLIGAGGPNTITIPALTREEIQSCLKGAKDAQRFGGVAAGDCEWANRVVREHKKK